MCLTGAHVEPMCGKTTTNKPVVSFNKVSSYPAQKARRDAFYAIAQALMEHVPVVLNDPLVPAGELEIAAQDIIDRHDLSTVVRVSIAGPNLHVEPIGAVANTRLAP